MYCHVKMQGRKHSPVLNLSFNFVHLHSAHTNQDLFLLFWHSLNPYYFQENVSGEKSSQKISEILIIMTTTTM